LITYRMSRREVLFKSLGLPFLSTLPASLLARNRDDPHFFMQIVLEEGYDSLYMFDSRPLSFTAAGKIAHFTQSEPELWEGLNGGKAFVASSFNRLRSFEHLYSVINGVHMPLGFDGHDENVKALFSANPFGGTYFATSLSTNSKPLDYVKIALITPDGIINNQNSLALNPDVANTLAEQAARLMTDSGTVPEPWSKWAVTRAKECAKGSGMFSNGCQRFYSSIESYPELARRLANTQVEPDGEKSDLEKAVQVGIKYFKAGISNSALIGRFGNGFDTHSPAEAKESHGLFITLADELARVFELLRGTPFDHQRSMLDVTTVMIGSEFNRTHLQTNKAVDESGTDHNPLGNSIILAGKGVRPGMVVGATDLDQLDGNQFKQVSKAHLSQDEKLFMRIGKAFDFAEQKPMDVLMDVYRREDYITIESVINTINQIFGVKKDQWLTHQSNVQGGNSSVAKSLHSLVKT
jgi:hypothetical protein